MQNRNETQGEAPAPAIERIPSARAAVWGCLSPKSIEK